MSDILFLAHRIPFPPDRGDKIRSHHVLKALARLAPVHVAAFADDAADWACKSDLEELAQTHCLVARRKPVALAAAQALVTQRPVSLCAFADRRIRAYVRRVLEERDIAVIYVFSGQMAHYVPASFSGRVVADLVDVDSAKFEAYGACGAGPRAWMERREGQLLAREEERIARRADATLLISEAEADLLRARLSRSCETVGVLGNGIDAATFAPSACPPDPRMQAAGYPRIVFTGQMDYAPNIAAVERAVNRVLPRLRERFADASFHIVGRNPGREVTALGTMPGVTVWGRVPDVRPYLAAADAALVPLDIARGVQNKVLEAMAMALPVVLTPGAATGIGTGVGGLPLRLENSDDALAEALAELARDPDAARALGGEARAWVEANASWDAQLAALPTLCGLSKSDEMVELDEDALADERRHAG